MLYRTEKQFQGTSFKRSDNRLLQAASLALDHFNFSCCSPIAVRISFCFPTSSASAVAPRLYPLQLQFPDCFRDSPLGSALAAAPDYVFFSCYNRLRPLQLILSDCHQFASALAACCSRVASAPDAAPRDCVRFSCCAPITSAFAAAPLVPQICVRSGCMLLL